MKWSVSQVVDAGLWQRFKSGNEDAYRHLYDHFAPILYSYGCKITCNDALVKDCLQDLFYNIGRKRNTLSNLTDAESIKYYLFCSLRHEIIRKMNLEAGFVSHTDRVTQTAFEGSVEEAVIASEDLSILQKTLRQAISQLSPRQQEAIHLRFYENTSFEDIANIMEITPRAAYKLIYRSISALQKVYQPAPGMNTEIISMPLLLVLLLFI